MLAFVVRRLIVSIPVLLLSSVLVFTLVTFSGDPLADLKAKNPPPSPAVIQAREHLLNLDKPIVTRYGIWLGKLVRGDMGQTIGGTDVRSDLARRLLVTARMVILAMIFAIILAVIVGVISAIRQYTALDYTFTFAGFLFLSMPVFWLGALLKEILAIKLNDAVGRTVVYTIGDQTPGLTGGFFGNFGNYAAHLVLPTITLAAISFASWSRFQRSSMLDVLNSDYVRLARAKGLSKSRVMVRHALRTALIPLVTVVAIDFGAILGGAVITERVFAWHGMGELLITGITSKDTNVVLAWLMVSAVAVIGFNLIADVLYAYLDPRIRHG
jgi:peptide/nickel transport system permease protein